MLNNLCLRLRMKFLSIRISMVDFFGKPIHCMFMMKNLKIIQAQTLVKENGSDQGSIELSNRFGLEMMREKIN